MKRKHTLITGASGFLGTSLLKALAQSENQDVHFFSLGRLEPAFSGLQSLEHSFCDLEDMSSLRKHISLIKPDEVFHLSGISQVSKSISFENYFKGNYLQTSNLLETLAYLNKPTRFLLASSVHVYGNQGGLIHEETPLKTHSPYAFTKFLAEECLQRFCKLNSNFQGLAVRLSSCLGPGQAKGFVASDFLFKIREALEKKRTSIQTGPLHTHRQFMDSRDVGRAFSLLMKTPQSLSFEVYNLASQTKITTAKLLDDLLKASGASLEIRSSSSDDNIFLGLDICTDKFQKIAPDFKFRPFQETVNDIWNVG